MTHYDADHLGGVDTMIDAGITVDSWFDRGEKMHLDSAKLAPGSQFSQYDSLAINETRLMPGATIDLDPEVTRYWDDFGAVISLISTPQSSQ